MKEAWQTSLPDFLILSENWDVWPPIHIVVASFVERKKGTDTPRSRDQKKHQKEDEMKNQNLAMDFQAERTVKQVPAKARFDRALEEVGGDVSKMQNLFEQSNQAARVSEIQAMRAELQREREAAKKVARGRPAW